MRTNKIILLIIVVLVELICITGIILAVIELSQCGYDLIMIISIIGCVTIGGLYLVMMKNIIKGD